MDEQIDYEKELQDTYRKFEAAHKAGDRKAAQGFKTYAEQIEAMRGGGNGNGAIPQEAPPAEEAGPALAQAKPPEGPGLASKAGELYTGARTALRLGTGRIASSYLTQKENARQLREKAVEHVKSRMPQEWLPEFDRIHNKSDFKTFDQLARVRFGKKYDDLIAEETKNPEIAKLYEQARGDKKFSNLGSWLGDDTGDATNLYDNIIRPFFTKEGITPADRANEFVEKMRNTYTEKQRAGVDKPWVAEGAEFFKPGSWFDGTTKAPWHDPEGFFLSVVEQAPNFAATIPAARLGGTAGARAALTAIGGAGGKRIDVVRKALSRGGKTGGTIAGTVTEGVMIRDQVGSEVYNRTMDLDDETWKTSEQYQKLRDGGMTDTEAKQIVATQTANKAGDVAMVISGAMGAPTSAYFGSLGTGLASRSFLKNVGKGALAETPEGAQELVEQVISNVGVRRVDPDQDVFDGAGEALVGGLFTSMPYGALGGATESRKGTGLAKEDQDTLHGIKPWEEAANARWKFQNKLSGKDWGKDTTPEEQLAELDKFAGLQQKEAEAFLRAEPLLRRSLIKNNRPDDDFTRLDQMKASAHTMLAQVKRAREERGDSRKEAAAARKLMKERQELVDAVEQDVLKRDDINRVAMNIERVRDQEALTGPEYSELEKLGYGRFADDKSRFIITQKGVRAIPELMAQMQRAQARVEGFYTGDERRKDSKLRDRMAEMTPEQFEEAVYRDPTTGVLNRRAFDEAEVESGAVLDPDKIKVGPGESKEEHAKRMRKAGYIESEPGHWQLASAPKAYAEVDVDSLKWVNDNMGAEVGDRMLKHIAKSLDQQEGITVYRVGGDEFVATGESEEQLEQAMQQAKLEVEDIQPITEGRQSIMPSVTWATGKSRKEASAKVTQQKAKREKKGTRAARGEKPPGYRDLHQTLLLHRDEDEVPRGLLRAARLLDEQGKSLSDYAAVADRILSGQKKKGVQVRINELERDLGRSLTDRERDNFIEFFGDKTTPAPLYHRDEGKPPTKAMQAIRKIKADVLTYFSDPPEGMNAKAAAIEALREEMVKVKGKPLSNFEKREAEEIFEEMKAHDALVATKRVLMHFDEENPGLLTEEELEQLDNEFEAISRRGQELRAAQQVTQPRTQGKTYRFGDLPKNMQNEITGYVKRGGIRNGIPPNTYLPLVDIPIDFFPKLPVNLTGTIGSDVPFTDLPPVVIARKRGPASGYWWIDGRHRVDAARRRGIASVPAIDIGEFVQDVGHGELKMKAEGVDRKRATYRDLNVIEREGGYPLASDLIPGQFPTNRLVVPMFIFDQINPEDLEFVLDGNGNLAIPSYIANDMFEHLMRTNGIENNHQVVRAVGQLKDAKLKDNTIKFMLKSNRGTITVRSFNAMLTGINMAANNLTAETVKGNPAMDIYPLYALERDKKLPKRPPVQGNIFKTAISKMGVTSSNYPTYQGGGYSGLQRQAQTTSFAPYVSTPSFVINDRTARLLGEKRLTGIWCNADDFFKANDLGGFATGMFVSEMSEAKMMGVEGATQEQVDESNRVYGELVGKHIGLDEDAMYFAVLADYSALAASNPVVAYNIKEMGIAREITDANRDPDLPTGNKTLVIHPKDKTTDFLKSIYEGHPEWTVVTGNKTVEEVNELIKQHDRVIMLGHGSGSGLMAVGQFTWAPSADARVFLPDYKVASRKKMRRAEALRQAMLSTYNNLPPITLQPAITDIDPSKFAEIVANYGPDAPHSVHAMFDPADPRKGITVAVGNIKEQDFDRLFAEYIFHELVGHYGLRGLMGSDVALDRISEAIRAGFPELARVEAGKLLTPEERKAISSVVEYAAAVDKVLADPARASIAGEEVFAHITGKVLANQINMTMPQKNVWQRAIHAVRVWLIKHGYGKHLRMTDKDIQYLIAAAQNFSRSGRPYHFVQRHGQRPLVFMRDGEIFKAGILTAIERGMRAPMTPDERSKAKASGLTQIPMFQDLASINAHVEAIRTGEKAKAFSKKEIEESNILNVLKVNPVEWLMGPILNQTEEQFSANVGIPLADVKSILAGKQQIDRKNADRILNYARTPGLLDAFAVSIGLMNGEELLSTRTIKNKLTPEAFVSGTVMSYRQLNELIAKARNQPNLQDPFEFMPEHYKREYEAEQSTFAVRYAAYEAELARAVAQHKKRPEQPKLELPLDEIVDPSKVKLSRDDLRKLVDLSSMPQVMPWLSGHDPRTAEMAKLTLEAKMPAEAITREMIEREMRTAGLLGADIGLMPMWWHDIPAGKVRSTYPSFTPFGAKTGIREYLFFDMRNPNKYSSGHFGAVYSDLAQLVANKHFAHVRLAIGEDASDNPPTAPNPAFQGKILMINEAQADPFQQIPGGFRSQDELNQASAKVNSNQAMLRQGIRNMGAQITNRIVNTMVERMRAKGMLFEPILPAAPVPERQERINKQHEFFNGDLLAIRTQIDAIVAKTAIATQKTISAFDARSFKRNELLVLHQISVGIQKGLYDLASNTPWSSTSFDMAEAVRVQLNRVATFVSDAGSTTVYNSPIHKYAIAQHLAEIYHVLGIEEHATAAQEDVGAMDSAYTAMASISLREVNSSEDEDIEFFRLNIDTESVMTRAVSALRGTAHTFNVEANAGIWSAAFTGPKERAQEALDAYREALKTAATELFRSSMIASRGRNALPSLLVVPTKEQLVSWLNLTELTREMPGFAEALREAGITGQEEWVDEQLDAIDWDDYHQDDTDALINWNEQVYQGHLLNTEHPLYVQYLEDNGEEEADEWLEARRARIRDRAREPGGVHYERLREEFNDQYDLPELTVLKGVIPEDEDRPTITLIKDNDGDWRARINHQHAYNEHGNSYGNDDDFNTHVVSVVRRWARDNNATLESPPWQEAAAETENYERIAPKIDKLLTTTIADGGHDAANLLRETKLLQTRIASGIGAQSVLSRDDQWKLIILRFTLAHAVRMGIPKIGYAGGEASTVRGGNWSPDWKNVKSLTWSMEKFDFGGKEAEYMVIRNIQMMDDMRGHTAPDGLILAKEHEIPVLGKDAIHYIEKQKAGQAPRSSGSLMTEPSRADLLVNRTPNGLYTVTRVGSNAILNISNSAEEMENVVTQMVEAARQRGGWSDQPQAVQPTGTPTALSVPPMGTVAQWGEVTDVDIGGPIQMLAGDVQRGYSDKPNFYHVLGARNSYDAMNRRLWNKELKKYGSEIILGKQYIPTNVAEEALSTQGMHAATDLPASVREQFGNVEIVESRGERHSYVVMGRDGPVLPTLFNTRAEAQLAMKSWVKDVNSAAGMTAIMGWEATVTDQIREEFGRGAITPLHYDPYSDPLIKAAAERIGGREPSLRDRYKRWRSMWKHAFTQGAMDRFYGIKRALKEAGLEKLEAEENGYIQARLTTSLDSVMRSIMEYGHPVWRGGIMETEGEGLIDILQPVATQVDLWAMYMAGVRAKRLLGEGRERMWTPEQIDRMVSLGETYPVFKRVAAEYAAFNKRVLDFAQEAGTINAETRAVWENADYIPFYRVQDDRIIGPMSSTSGIANVSSPIKTLKGGTENVGDLMHNIMINLTKLMDGAMKNHAALTTVDALRPSGIVSNQPMAWSEQLIPMEQVKKALKERGVDPDTIPVEALTGFQKMFALQAPKGEGVISVMRGGKKEFYHTSDPLLYRAMTAINKQYFGNWMRLLRAPKRLLTTWITLDPGFMIANYLRDALSSFVISRDNVIPLVDGMGGFVRALGQSEEMRTMMSAGAAFENGYINQYDPASTQKMLKRSFKSASPTDVMLDSPRKLYELWKRIGSATENANRIAVYRAAIAAGKSKAQAAYEAKDLMDFSMGGDWPVVQFLLQTVPFLGARVQGLHRLGRAFHEHPLATTLKGFFVGAAGMALWLAFRDDERYKELEDWDKDTYFHFWIGDNHYRLPKPFEVGAIFNTIPERAMEALWSKETDAGRFLLKRYGFVLSEMFNMNPIPQAAQPMVEMWFNYNFFTRSQIESPYEEQRLPPERYRYNTSPAMIELARALPAGLDTVSGKIRSPLQLQNLYYGYTGTLGKYFLMGADALVRESMDLPAPPTMSKGDYPVIGRFARGTEPRRTRYEEEFYNTLRRAIQAQGSVKFLEDVEEDKRLEYVEGKYEPVIDVAKDLERFREEVSGINKEMREIYMDKKKDPDRKRTEINSLQEEKNEIFEEAYHLRPGGRDNMPTLTPDKISFFIEKFNKDEPPPPDLVKAAPVTAELLTDVSGLTRKQLHSLARASGAPE